MSEPGPVDLDALLEGVCDERTFIEFIDALAADFERDSELVDANPDRYKYAPGLLGWENGTVSAFLSAAAAWGPRSPHENPWQRAAHILYAGKWYE